MRARWRISVRGSVRRETNGPPSLTTKAGRATSTGREGVSAAWAGRRYVAPTFIQAPQAAESTPAIARIAGVDSFSRPPARSWRSCTLAGLLEGFQKLEVVVGAGHLLQEGFRSVGHVQAGPV